MTRAWCQRGGITSSPAFTVGLDVYDDLGNLYATYSRPRPSPPPGPRRSRHAGLHGGAASSYLVLPQWGRVELDATCPGGTFTGVEIALFGR